MSGQSPMPLRLAMWSGPRNISTAMMRAFENRTDCRVIDEPLYAHYLAATGSDHPGRADVIAHGETDWRRVVASLLGPVPNAQPIWYQKHMTHHLLPDMERDWILQLTNVFLIRDPRDVVASYIKSRAAIAADDIGLRQEVALFDFVAAHLGHAPTVIDANSFLTAPEAHLRALCTQLGIAFSARMLHWRPGPRASDGVWAPHWYSAVWQSSGFEAPRTREPMLDDAAAEVAEQARPWYEHLYRHRLRVTLPPGNGTH